jgi:hypothetical protein
MASGFRRYPPTAVEPSSRFFIALHSNTYGVVRHRRANGVSPRATLICQVSRFRRSSSSLCVLGLTLYQLRKRARIASSLAMASCLSRFCKSSINLRPSCFSRNLAFSQETGARRPVPATRSEARAAAQHRDGHSYASQSVFHDGITDIFIDSGAVLQRNPHISVRW